MMDQLDLLEEARRVTQAAIERVDAAADAEWKQTAYRCVEWLARTRDTFTTDDIWLAMERHYPDVTTHEKRALGPVMTRAVRSGVIQKTGEFRTSIRPEAHQAVVFVYRATP